MERATDEIVPELCPNGHLLDSAEPVRSWIPCWCSRAADDRHGHRTYRCRSCQAVVYLPDHVAS